LVPVLHSALLGEEKADPSSWHADWSMEAWQFRPWPWVELEDARAKAPNLDSGLLVNRSEIGGTGAWDKLKDRRCWSAGARRLGILGCDQRSTGEDAIL